MVSWSLTVTGSALSDPNQFLWPKLAAESLGSCLLVACVVGSGIMAWRLADGNEALTLLCNTAATGAMLFVLITIFGPISGAHFNPAVTLASVLRRELKWRLAAAFAGAQFFGAICGTWLAHAMFDEPVLQMSSKLRDGPGQFLSEFVATFGLVLTIVLTARHHADRVAGAVACYIVAAYWFTASTSFANPAVTLARMLSDSFAGIAMSSVPYFVAA
jgi:glycerol uptake facilitator-like aquaporin